MWGEEDFFCFSYLWIVSISTHQIVSVVIYEFLYRFHKLVSYEQSVSIDCVINSRIVLPPFQLS